ncbi:dnaJ homolog subfamily C member 18-like [Papaver somniferum]|uniref:dnaJ homolog subfamily C member 18-like n=1 Tax=Papaver somniferum TaxID=3469 RepID=UPI000E6F6ED8|nr:dnaJ homolog subfamily C member 18-like [Papaver somniferum]
MEEEAQFLRDDAEIKFKAQDFAGALWLANMAQDLDPNLQGIQQYIAAYSVHVAAYESNTIKKQYKRMALLVHPDKNGSIAAESAFKLIQDANEILSDPITRMGFELKRNRSKPASPTPTASTSSTKVSAKPSVNRHDDKSKYKTGQSSSYYYDDCEYDEDTWPDEEEDEEDFGLKGLKLLYSIFIHMQKRITSSPEASEEEDEEEEEEDEDE